MSLIYPRKNGKPFLSSINRAKPYVNHGDHGPEPRFPGDAWTMWYCCSACDNPVTEGDRYCKTCGAELDWSSL